MAFRYDYTKDLGTAEQAFSRHRASQQLQFVGRAAAHIRNPSGVSHWHLALFDRPVRIGTAVPTVIDVTIARVLLARLCLPQLPNSAFDATLLSAGESYPLSRSHTAPEGLQTIVYNPPFLTSSPTLSFHTIHSHLYFPHHTSNSNNRKHV